MQTAPGIMNSRTEIAHLAVASTMHLRNVDSEWRVNPIDTRDTETLKHSTPSI